MNSMSTYLLRRGAIFLMASFILVPLFWMILTSLISPEKIHNHGFALNISDISLSNYINLLSKTNFTKYFTNSLLTATLVTILTNLVAFVGAYAHTRFDYRGKAYFEIASLLTYMVAPIMLVIPLYMLFKSLGVNNTQFALITSHVVFCFPFAFWFIRVFLMEIPVDYEKAAKIDGASILQMMIYIVLPNVLPGVFATCIFTFILSWNDYVFARILVSSDNIKTIPVGIEDIYNASVTDWGMLMASGILVSIPIVLCLIGSKRALNLKLLSKSFSKS